MVEHRADGEQAADAEKVRKQVDDFLDEALGPNGPWVICDISADEHLLNDGGVLCNNPRPAPSAASGGASDG
jgi:hypothetical protein